MSKKLKIGQMSKKELTFIQENAMSMTLSEMAEILNRSPANIKRGIDMLGIVVPEEQEEVTDSELAISKKLTMSPEWNRLREELTPSELVYFGKQYRNFIGQFNNDILPTEELQLFQLIKFNILMQRTQRDNKRNIKLKIKAEREIANIELKNKDGKVPAADKARIKLLEDQVIALQSAISDRNSDFVKYQVQQNGLLKELKATREQRIKKIESSSKDFIGLIKLMQEADFREKEGRILNLNKSAEKLEQKKLGSYHKYIDGTYDKPILSPETVEDNE